MIINTKFQQILYKNIVYNIHTEYIDYSTQTISNFDIAVIVALPVTEFKHICYKYSNSVGKYVWQILL